MTATIIPFPAERARRKYPALTPVQDDKHPYQYYVEALVIVKKPKNIDALQGIMKFSYKEIISPKPSAKLRDIIHRDVEARWAAGEYQNYQSNFR
jgi:hypothetical protein